MKKLILLSILFIVGCSKKPVDESLLFEKDRLMYEHESKKPFNGKVFGLPMISGKSELKTISSKGKKVERWLYEGDYENGKLIGKYIFYEIFPNPALNVEYRTIKTPIEEEQVVIVEGRYVERYGPEIEKAIKGQDFEPFTGEISQSYDIYKVDDDIAYTKIIKYGILTDYVFYNRDGSIIEPANEETTLEKEENDGTYVSRIGSDEPFWGKVYGLYPNGAKFYDGIYINGLLDGDYTYYKKDGSIQEPIKETILVDKDGKKNIPLFGLISKEGKFIPGTNEPYWGLVYGQYHTGEKMYDGLYKDGVLIGDYTWYGFGDTPDWQVSSGQVQIKKGKDNLWYNGDMVYSGISDNHITGKGTYYKGLKHGKWENGSYLFGEKYGKWHQSGYEVVYTNNIPSTSFVFGGYTGQGFTRKKFDDMIKISDIDRRDVIENNIGINGLFTNKETGENITGSFFIQEPEKFQKNKDEYQIIRPPSIFFTLKDGKLNGRFCIWSGQKYNHRIELKGSYIDGIGDGPWIKYYQSTRTKYEIQKWYEITLKGINDGHVYQVPYPHWDDSYGIVEEGVTSFATLGRPDGIYTIYTAPRADTYGKKKGGELIIEGNYNDGVETGVWKGYHTSNGNIWWQAAYEGGNIDLVNYIHYPTKNRLTLGGYYLGNIKPIRTHGNPSGFWIEWDKYGNKELEIDYNKQIVLFYSEGQKEVELVMSRGKLSGFRGNYVSGNVTEYHGNGQVARKGTIESGKEIGFWSFWYSDGEKIGEGQYKGNYESENDPESLIESIHWEGTFVVDTCITFPPECWNFIKTYKNGKEIHRSELKENP